MITSVEITGPLKFARDIGDLKNHYHIPYFRLTNRPGLGVEVDEEILTSLTVMKDIVV